MTEVVIIGCGWRGQVFAEYAKNHSDEMKVLAIADKKQHLRDKMKREYNIEDKYIFKDYHDLFAHGKIGDAIFIATQDNQHIEPSKEMCTPIDISIESHAMCHAAEISRKDARSVKVKELL